MKASLSVSSANVGRKGRKDPCRTIAYQFTVQGCVLNLRKEQHGFDGLSVSRFGMGSDQHEQREQRDRSHNSAPAAKVRGSVGHDSLSLLQAVLTLHPDTPRGRAKQWILAGRVRVNGAIVRRPHQQVHSRDEIRLGERHASTLDCGSGLRIHPRVTLMYLDAAVSVVNKGPGLISVPASGDELSALSILADFLAGKLKPQHRTLAGYSLPPAYRRLEPLPVHRLDQYTSGVFCMAMNPSARGELIEQLKQHTMRREYIAFVEGRSTARKGQWRNWLRLSRDEMRQHVLSEAQAREAGDDAREAVTHYEVIREYSIGGNRFVTKLRLRLETGRKHQIRVQAANAGLPLIGDRTYNPSLRSGGEGSALIAFPRQALHAEVLSLEHPEQPGRKMSWRADLPQDLKQLEASLNAANATKERANPVR